MVTNFKGSGLLHLVEFPPHFLQRHLLYNVTKVCNVLCHYLRYVYKEEDIKKYLHDVETSSPETK